MAGEIHTQQASQEAFLVVANNRHSEPARPRFAALAWKVSKVLASIAAAIVAVGFYVAACAVARDDEPFSVVVTSGYDGAIAAAAYLAMAGFWALVAFFVFPTRRTGRREDARRPHT